MHAGGQLLTPSSKGARTPREASPEKTEAARPQPPLVDQIKEAVTEILTAVTDEVFREAAREAISNQRRKQQITGKTKIGLKLQGAGGGPGAPQQDAEPEAPKALKDKAGGTQSPSKREDQEKLPGVVYSEGEACDRQAEGLYKSFKTAVPAVSAASAAVTVGAYRCPANATPPPPGVFSVTIYEDGVVSWLVCSVSLLPPLPLLSHCCHSYCQQLLPLQMRLRLAVCRSSRASL